MQSDIVAKLQRHLERGVDTEPSAVYLLCEVRKILDHEKAGSTLLRAFCNWAVHVDLHHKGSASHILAQMDAVLTNKFEKRESGDTLRSEDALTNELTYFSGFRKELREFLEHQGLPADLCVDDRKWANFLLAYTGVIEDGSLVYDFHWIKKATFRIDDHAMEGSHLPFTMVWRIELQREIGGYPALEISVSGDEDGRFTAFSGFGLRR